ncbi:hypothetical protein EDD37DRAFT_389136 [Exophiala viscosa]|uniref:Letm1 RBD domain-containing protein n=1 Tax=Exophiala viscosa TaxID=2486360 RepID=A0AAN6DNR4_9EURO|nr:hypothetical protein EDD36DRAFT_469050 [Exophiala viscosa]KAI1625470.1 hypothetical protein EDD37DRAFT_389136 [Exophiala viscosa]
MSVILSHFRNAALSCSNGGLRSRNITASLKVVYSSISIPRPVVPPRSRRPACFLERFNPTFFSKDPQYPDISTRPEVSRTRNNVPRDLADLRPTPLEQVEYVEGPEETEDGRITSYQRFLYWRRLGKAYYKFYQEGMRKVSANQREREQILSRYKIAQNSMADVTVTYMVLYQLYAGEGMRRRASDEVPKLTRREYNICIRTMEDVRNSWPFSFILFFFRGLTPLIHQFISPLIPGPCRREQDQLRDMKRLFKGWESLERRLNEQDELYAKSRTAAFQVTRRRHMLYTAVLRTSIFSGFAKYIPPSLTWFGMRLYGKGLISRHEQILADTVLIMREGGFSKLSTEDVVDYCIRSGSIAFYEWARKAVERGESYKHAFMERHMVPILEQHAKKMLDCDWPRLSTGSLWKQEIVVRFYDRTAPDSWFFNAHKARR